jgi:hypothetical protein
MDVSRFESLCEAMCEAAACRMPPVARGDDGAAAIALSLKGVEVTLAYDPARGRGHAFVLVRFGALPQGRELQACTALLRTNCLMLRVGAPSFGSDSRTHDILLQHVIALDDVSPVDLYQAIAGFVDVAARWQETFFLGKPTLDDAALRLPQHFDSFLSTGSLR